MVSLVALELRNCFDTKDVMEKNSTSSDKSSMNLMVRHVGPIVEAFASCQIHQNRTSHFLSRTGRCRLCTKNHTHRIVTELRIQADLQCQWILVLLRCHFFQGRSVSVGVSVKKSVVGLGFGDTCVPSATVWLAWSLVWSRWPSEWASGVREWGILPCMWGG